MDFIFKKIRISDVVNKCSKTIEFSEYDNLITSENNSMGKSVLMKSLYHSLGADSAFDKNFHEDNILFSLDFVYGENEYRILRFKDAFSVIKNNMLINFINAKCRPDLSLFFKNEFGISVYLKNRKNTIEIAPPAYLFIPYYLDQDRSWKEEQEPFSKNTMWQYEPISRNDLYFYHLGIYTSEYGCIKSDIGSLSKEIGNQESELTKFDLEYSKVKKIFDNELIITDTKELESIYRSKSNEINALMHKQNQLTQQLFELDQQRTSCLLQIKSNKKVIDKIKQNRNPNSLVVQCPNCNEEFDVQLKNDVVNLYSIVVIEKENESLKLETEQLEVEIQKIKQGINDLAIQLKSANDEANSSRTDYEKYVTRKALSSLLDKQLLEIGDLTSKISSNKAILENKKSYLAKLKEKTDNAKTFFCSEYTKYLHSLGINQFSSNDICAFKKLALSGSQYVRSTLALYFAFIKTKMKFNPDNFCFPIVIDSPREGEQDENNSSNILETILSENIGTSQRIVASVNAQKYISKETLNNVNVIELTGEQGHIMSREEYLNDENDIQICLSYFKRIS